MIKNSFQEQKKKIARHHILNNLDAKSNLNFSIPNTTHKTLKMYNSLELVYSTTVHLLLY